MQEDVTQFLSIELVYVATDSVDVNVGVFNLLARSVDLPQDHDGINVHG